MHIAVIGTKTHSTEIIKSSTFLWYCILCCTKGSNFSQRGHGLLFSVIQYFFAYILKVRICLILSDFYKIMILTWNTVFPRIIAGAIISFLYKKGAIIGRRRLFKILLTGSRALNIMVYFPIKSKNNHVNMLMGS